MGSLLIFWNHPGRAGAWEIESLHVLDMIVGKSELLLKFMIPVKLILGVFTCRCSFKWFKHGCDLGCCNVKSFIEANPASHVFNLFDIFLLDIGQGTLPVWGG